MGEKEYQKIFSKNLRKYMALHSKTQIDLINDLGLDKSTVSTWVNGTRLPRMDKINMLAEYFGINRSDLIEDKPIKAPTPSTPQLRPDEQQLLDGYNLLDQDDKSEIRGEIKGMLKAEKYQKKDGGLKEA